MMENISTQVELGGGNWRLNIMNDSYLKIVRQTVPDLYDGALPDCEVDCRRFPVLLLQNYQGVAVGFGCTHVSYCVADVVDVLVSLIEDKLPPMIFPDLPSGGNLVYSSGLISAVINGRGTFQLVEPDGGSVSINVNATVFVEGEIVTLGVYDICQRWIDWRRDMLKAIAQRHIDKLNQRQKQVQLVLDIPSRELSRIAYGNLCEGYQDWEIEFLLTLPLSTWRNLDKWREEYKDNTRWLAHWLTVLDNPDWLIKEQLAEIRLKHSEPRRTGLV